MPLGRIDGDDGRGFAQSVAFQQFGAGELGFEIEDGLFRQRRAAADKQANAVEPSEIPRDFRLAHRGVNRGYAQKHGRAFEQCLFQNVGKRKNGFDQNNRTRHINRQQHHSRQREAVEHRQENDKAVALGNFKDAFDAVQVGEQVGVTD